MKFVISATTIVPLIAPVVALIQGLKDDSESFDEFINAKK